MAERIHIAGFPVRVGSQCRQRCAWCEHVLIDEDMRLIAVAPHEDGTPGDPTPTFYETGALVAVDGGASWIVRHTDGDPLPTGACAIPPPPPLKLVASDASPSPPTAADLCRWCGETYGDHADARGPMAPVPRVPCLLLKAHFKPEPARG